MAETTKEHLTRHDREIAGIRKLLLQGGKMLAGIDKRLDRLVATQLVTEKKLQRLIDALERGSNGKR